MIDTRCFLYHEHQDKMYIIIHEQSGHNPEPKKYTNARITPCIADRCSLRHLLHLDTLGDRGSEHRPQRFPRFRYITFRTMRSAMSRAFVSSRAVRPLRRRGRPCCGRPCRLVAPLRPALPSIASPRVAAPRGARALGPWYSRCPAVLFFFFFFW